jgi:hypothetical protein
VSDDLTGQAVIGGCVLLALVALAISTRAGSVVTGIVAVLLALAPLLGVIWQVTR